MLQIKTVVRVYSTLCHKIEYRKVGEKVSIKCSCEDGRKYERRWDSQSHPDPGGSTKPLAPNHEDERKESRRK